MPSAPGTDHPIVREPSFARLLELLAIPSVSADPEHAHDVARAGQWICDYMHDVPGCTTELRELPGARHPSVVGRVKAARDQRRAPTVAVYGHFDVQPPGRQADWSSEPFHPEIREGWLYARGAADDKVNCFIVLEAIKRLATTVSLPVNIELLFDGEEEIDGMSIPAFAARRPAPDAAVICDGALWDEITPCFYISARGTLYYRLTIRTAQRELHSGSFGGAALNAAQAMIDCLHLATQGDLGESGTSCPSLEALHQGAETLRRAGAQPADAAAAEQFYQRTVLRSAVDVNSICAGDVGLQKTVIPADVTADVSVRVAPGDDHQRLDAEFCTRLREHTPAGAQLSIERLAMVPPGQTRADSEPVLLAAAAFERVYGSRPLLVGVGGTLPLFSAYTKNGVPVIMTGFADPAGAPHAANECFPLRNLPAGIDAACELLRGLARLTPAIPR